MREKEGVSSLCRSDLTVEHSSAVKRQRIIEKENNVDERKIGNGQLSVKATRLPRVTLGITFNKEN